MISIETSVRVRYGETDQMGILYYGNYALFYEVGRAEWLRSFDMSYKKIEENGILMPVVSLECRYLKAAYYDDLIRIKTVLKEKPGRLISLYHELFNQSDELINKGKVTLAFIDEKTRKACHPPELLMNKLKPYF